MRVGAGVMVAKNCTIIGAGHGWSNIEIGDNVRIDGFTTIAAADGFLKIGSHIHVGGYAFLQCSGGVTLSDFCNLSQRVSIYSKSDDYTGAFLTNPTVAKEFLGLKVAPVVLGRHVIIGSGSVVLPGCSIGEGSALGALSLVTRKLAPWGIYAGAPARLIRPRSRDLLEKEAEFLRQVNSVGEP